jgi:hypothetical protein
MQIRTPNHIALVGLGPGRGEHKEAQAEAVWGINTVILLYPVDLVINMHDLPRDLESHKTTHPKDYAATKRSLETAAAEGIPVLTCKRHPDYPVTLPFPIETIINAAGIDYFTCTSVYALAYAIFTGAKRIDLYGVTGGENYQHQHPCLEYWIGRGHGHGVDIRSHGMASRLMRTDPGRPYAPTLRQTRYGYDREPVGAREYLEKVINE